MAVVVSEETGQIRLALDGGLERGPDDRRSCASGCACCWCSGGRGAARRGAGAYDVLMAYHPFRHLGPEGAGARAGHARSGSPWPASTSSSAACACRSSSGTCRRRWRSSATRRRRSTCGCAGRRRSWAASSPARSSRCSISRNARTGLAAVPPAHRRGARAVRRRGRAGDAADAVADAREVGAAHACRSCRRSKGSRRPASSSGG